MPAIRIACSFTTAPFDAVWHAWRDALDGADITVQYCSHGAIEGAIAAGEIGAGCPAVRDVDVYIINRDDYAALALFEDAVRAARAQAGGYVVITHPRDSDDLLGEVFVADDDGGGGVRLAGPAAASGGDGGGTGAAEGSAMPPTAADVLLPQGLLAWYPYAVQPATFSEAPAVKGAAGGGADMSADPPPVPAAQVFEEPVVHQAAGVPYQQGYYARIAAAVLRRAFHGVLKEKFKVMCMDCDWTLWHGTAGEKGGDVPVPIAPVQRALKRLKDAGRLVVLLSRNRREAVEAVFEGAPGMVLRLSDIAGMRVNYKGKPDNIRDVIENELALGTHSCMFVDDNPIEVHQMRMHRPEVASFLVTDISRAVFLRHNWAWDVYPSAVSATDRLRNASYAAEQTRRTAKAACGSFRDFMAKLDVQVTVGGDRARMAQLSVRTNQFNSNAGLRLAESDLARMLAPNDQPPSYNFFTVAARDAFGDYGGVGGVLFHEETDADGGVGAVVIDLFAMSCRVLHRGVEQAMIAEVSRRALVRGCAEIRMPYGVTERNTPYRNFAAALAGTDGFAYAGGAAAAAATADQDSGESKEQRHVLTWSPARGAALTWEDTYEYASGVSAPAGDAGAGAAATATEATTTPPPSQPQRALDPAELLQRVLALGDAPPLADALRGGDAGAGGGAPAGGVPAAAPAARAREIVAGALRGVLGCGWEAQVAGGEEEEEEECRRRRLSDAGMDSLKLVALLSALAKAAAPHGIAVDGEVVLSDPTVGELEAIITEKLATAADAAKRPASGSPVVGGQHVKAAEAAVRAAAASAWRTADPDMARPLADLPNVDDFTLPVFFAALPAGVFPPHWSEGMYSRVLSLQAVVDKLAAARAAAAEPTAKRRKKSEPKTQAKGRSANASAAKKERQEKWKNCAHVEDADTEGGGLFAAKRGDIAALEAKRAGGWDPMKQADKHGLNALAWGAGMGHLDVVEWCLGRGGVDVNSRSKDGRTPVMWACRNGHLEVVKQLAAHGADMRAVNKKGNTCVHWAVWGLARGVAEYLILDLQHSVHDTNFSGCCAAIWGATSGDVEFCKWLHALGADFTRMNDWGHGCVVKASWRNNVPFLEWLFRDLALDPMHLFYLDVDGLTPLDLARKQRHAGVVAWLEAEMAKYPTLATTPSPSIRPGVGRVEY